MQTFTSRDRTRQDRQYVIAQIAERIRRMMPLVYWDSARKNELLGRTQVRFRMNSGGYVAVMEVLRSSGDAHVDAASRTVLHLAEPYVFVPGWIELELAFKGQSTVSTAARASASASGLIGPTNGSGSPSW